MPAAPKKPYAAHTRIIFTKNGDRYGIYVRRGFEYDTLHYGVHAGEPTSDGHIPIVAKHPTPLHLAGILGVMHTSDSKRALEKRVYEIAIGLAQQLAEEYGLKIDREESLFNRGGKGNG